MSATPLSRQDREEVKVVVHCIVKGYQECLFNVNIGKEFAVKSKIVVKGIVFKLCNKRGQLGYLQRELVAPLWLLKRPLSDSKGYVNLLLYITLVSPKVLTGYLKFQILPESFLPQSIVTGKSFDDLKGQWRRGGGINEAVTLEILLSSGEAKKFNTEIKALGIWCQRIGSNDLAKLS